ncbi:hypothetical protein [Snuella sedimenti]|uniref:Uncharacterized protein n=1 Tax=Snuella sedimenti TaxID=2798802 RepID=A0A8J7J4Q9_9FLAO|nr:hypothetical protein [Snuella sedimenti]MBJ6369877.1 hypothetical protein [Snuella sedimenti]
MSSRQEVFHPEPLTEPYVVSHDTALLIQIYTLNLKIQHTSDKTGKEIVSEPRPAIYRHLLDYFCTYHKRLGLAELKKTLVSVKLKEKALQMQQAGKG